MPRKKVETKPAPVVAPAAPGAVLIEGLLPSKDTLDVVERLAATFRAARVAEGTQEQTVTLILRGLELGVPPGQAVRDLYIGDDGTMAMRAGLMRAKIEGSGKGHLEVPEFGPEKVKVVGVRYGNPARCVPVEWTIARARSLGLVKSGNAWEKYPAESMFGRATSMVARLLFEDIVSGCGYVPEEIMASGRPPQQNVAPAPAAAPKAPAGREGTPTPADTPVSRGAAPEAPAAPEKPGEAPAQATLPVTPAAPVSVAPGANGGQKPVRPLTHAIQIEKKGGGVQTVMTGGMTASQLTEIMQFTSEGGQHRHRASLREIGKACVRALEIPTVHHLNEAEAAELILRLRDEVPRLDAPPTDPVWAAAMRRLDAAIAKHGLVADEPLIQEYALAGRTGYAVVPAKEVAEVAKFVEEHGGDRATFVLLLERARQDAAVG